ncbi:hypothetical protein LOZ53_001615 [Ophidiomyces ophidiicola]|uniref:Uncharacterized protein n=1 Tax=Ophidiomyces ophidiicola TaxID=1387563 RepID=A0ACB8UTF8_9EURO|nr:uncharacterized protein LOZ57_001978 [Ophidiomyces ophidiicola]KAI1914483.1 hypothetical protein LOZ61_002151 [Ophidiomyces ophidiicola]KAI1941448.1 hypothetical protein LOZ62_004734 [Ophidiomyces ophidiicola]KAI1950419.1 hypothetical protein LOZ57_001978 [Ophidiomyces ophidiicola]KAI1953535.1 hypothetical protein LOZ59_005028 [Ophidiomyces ophidiicola]KAI1990534.1 hypothetical protein LOZ51_004885 [Ophidiomyces ophidiicola]
MAEEDAFVSSAAARDRDSETEEFEDEAFSDSKSASFSLEPSVTNYPEEHGRRYHAYRRGRYLLPNDDKEMQRLNLVDALVRHILGGLHLAPIGSNPQRVLDIGTGSGAWAINFADKYPSAEVVHLSSLIQSVSFRRLSCPQVIGNDLSPTQPDDVPPNVRFIVDDVEEDWDCLRPGGWLEVQDFDSRIHSADGSIRGTCLEHWDNSTMEAFARLGFWTRVDPQFGTLLHDVGFTNIQMKRFSIPLGNWHENKRSQQLGELNAKQLTEVLEAASLAVLTRSGWTEQAVYAMCAGARNDAQNQKIHAELDL